MQKVIGLWIDQREAVIVLVNDSGEEIQHRRFSPEQHIRFLDNGLANMAENKRDRRLTGQLNNYYDLWNYYEAILAQIRAADSILIMGPNQTKVEIKNRLESEGLGGRIAVVETVDKITERQIAARVREYVSAVATTASQIR